MLYQKGKCRAHGKCNQVHAQVTAVEEVPAPPTPPPPHLRGFFDIATFPVPRLFPLLLHLEHPPPTYMAPMSPGPPPGTYGCATQNMQEPKNFLSPSGRGATNGGGGISLCLSLSYEGGGLVDWPKPGKKSRRVTGAGFFWGDFTREQQGKI